MLVICINVKTHMSIVKRDLTNDEYFDLFRNVTRRTETYGTQFFRIGDQCHGILLVPPVFLSRKDQQQPSLEKQRKVEIELYPQLIDAIGSSTQTEGDIIQLLKEIPTGLPTQMESAIIELLKEIPNGSQLNPFNDLIKEYHKMDLHYREEIATLRGDRQKLTKEHSTELHDLQRRMIELNRTQIAPAYTEEHPKPNSQCESGISFIS